MPIQSPVLTEDLLQQIGTGRHMTKRVCPVKTRIAPRQPLIHHLKRLPISAVFQLRYL